MEKERLRLNSSQVDKAVRQFYSRAGFTVLSQVRNGIEVSLAKELIRSVVFA
jgi:hypothetical protein